MSNISYSVNFNEISLQNVIEIANGLKNSPYKIPYNDNLLCNIITLESEYLKKSYDFSFIKGFSKQEINKLKELIYERLEIINDEDLHYYNQILCDI